MRVKRKRIVVNLTRSIKANLRKLSLSQRKTVTLMIAIGDDLIHLKTEVEHGDWINWLHDEFALSIATAEMYMDFARNSERVQILAEQGYVARGIKAALQADRRAAKQALAQRRGTTFSAEQAARQSHRQEIKNTFHWFEHVANGSELVNTRLIEEVWPDPVERARKQAGWRLAQHLLQQATAPSADEQQAAHAALDGRSSRGACGG
jgi:hypothetical protein